MRRNFLRINLVLSSIIVIGVFLQAYFIATYIIGDEESALDAHGILGGLVIHLSELLVFLTAFGAWPRQWRWIGFTFALFFVGTVQIFLLPSDSDDPVSSGAAWVHGLHGLLALVVLVMAAEIAHRAMRDLGVRGGRRDELAGAETPPPPP
jgi:hypothetical protein